MLSICKIFFSSYVFLLSLLLPVLSKLVAGIKVVTEYLIQDFPAVFANHFFRKTLPLAVFLRACTFPTFSNLGSEDLRLVKR